MHGGLPVLVRSKLKRADHHRRGESGPSLPLPLSSIVVFTFRTFVHFLRLVLLPPTLHTFFRRCLQQSGAGVETLRETRW